MNRILRYINNQNENLQKSDSEDNLSESETIYTTDSSYYNDEDTEDTNITDDLLLESYINLDYKDSGHDLKFNNEWNIWYHHIKNNWKLEGFNKIFTISSVKEFWDFNNNINLLGGINSHHFFMMRKNITPIWEDPENKNGGCWSIKIPTEKSLELWIKLSSYIVGETLIDNSNLINGISICAKNPITSVVKIWNSDTKKNSIKLLPVDILNEYGFNIIYKSHIPEY